jgi:hypothetical protein
MVISNGSEIDSYFSSGITIGYDLGDLLFCGPEFSGRPPELSSDYIYGEINKQDPRQPYHLIPLPEGFIETHIVDTPGDTVMILWSGGTFKAVINDILFLEDVCNGEIVCALKPITELKDRPKRFRDFIALRKEKFYDGSIIPYTEYQINDSSYLAIVDSITQVMTRTRLAENNARFEEQLARMPEDRKEQYIANWEKRTADAYYPLSDIRYHLYGIESGEVPDQLFLMVIGYTSSTEASWAAKLELTPAENGWRTKTISEPGLGSFSYIIRFAFDLNGDGELEYLINNSIFILLDGEFTPVVYGPYRGC